VIAAVLGAATPPGRLHKAVADALERAGEPFAFFDLATPPDLEAVARADAVLLATPIYRGSFTGVLKTALDELPVEALQGKPVAIVAMGATDHHSLGADWHLRDVLAWFGALTLPTSVYLTSKTHDSDAGREQLDQLLATLVTLARVVPKGLGPAPLAAARPR